MQPKMTRRALAAGLAASPALAQSPRPRAETLQAQAPKPQAPPPGEEQPAASKSPDEEARETVQRNSEALRKTKVPVMLEPTFVFRP
jgi:hypothetical protein